MTTTEQVRENVARCAVAGGVDRCSAYLTDVINPTQGMVLRPPFDPRLVFGGGKYAMPLKLVVYMTRSTDVASQKLIDRLCDRDAVPAALQDSGLWTVEVDYCQVLTIGQAVIARIQRPSSDQIDEYMSFDIDMEVVW